MSKEKLPSPPISKGYSSYKSTDIRSSESEASDTEDVCQSNNLSADNSNSSRSSLLRKSIDLNDDDDDDDNAINTTQLD
ncbi:hypothetical protein CLPUN_26680 [Clostridium puniceum]|uniref:Uncharacterized protein n=1 Tax=Clostridium puniceum TaxID=29367 RepID=A0A1S8TFI4_9CLOT|nr:hypothetical protein [Clostridium puniceum]OOM76436.1 hypothetical protein CLPUN_26680 [Clostridium puniceum]